MFSAGRLQIRINECAGKSIFVNTEMGFKMRFSVLCDIDTSVLPSRDANSL